MLSTFIAASTLICIAPGPSMLIVIKSSVEGGLRRGLNAILGVILADALLLYLSMSGLAILLPYYTAVKLLGAAFLLYLGCSTLLTKEAKSEKQKVSDSPFLGALGVTLLNPKIIGFFIAFFPQFLNREESLNRQLALLGPLFLLIVFLILLAYSLFAGMVREQLSKGVWNKVFKMTTGLTLIACAFIALC